MSTSRSFPNAFQRRTQERLDTRERPTEYPGAFQRRTQDNVDTRDKQTDYPGAFQQKRRDDRQYGRSNPAFGQQSYGQWKRHEDPVKPKEVHIESTIDFPSLTGATATKATQQATVSLAEKLKVAIQQEQEQATQRSYRKDSEKYDEIKIPLSLGSLMRRREQEKKEAEEARLESAAQMEDEDEMADDEQE